MTRLFVMDKITSTWCVGFVQKSDKFATHVSMTNQKFQCGFVLFTLCVIFSFAKTIVMYDFIHFKMLFI